MTANSAERTPMIHTPTSPSPRPETSSNNSSFQSQPQQALPQIFDYASFMWDGGEAWHQMLSDVGRGIDSSSHPLVSLRRFHVLDVY
jgi:hypothetical protein